ncbi:SOS response-associated peptidase [Rothia aerolata]|uniref:Abasic site processing protein n=1 Tax=Rothia aerolata TaxID=1812262 RepID=A0A917ILH6_9MICC|nr:SOS response-associated peptidase [Rothia aerolata]GGH57983.1 DUF159 family protein [Rothia aerolata]
MCGRYVLDFDHGVYMAGVPLEAPIQNFNVAPTHTVPIIIDNFTGLEPAQTALLVHGQAGETGQAGGGVTPNRELHAARWGLLPTWAEDASFSAKAFNARSETIFEKPTFRQAATAGHCAIPVSGYYEWKTETTTAGKQVKTPHFIHRADQDPIYFAGLYSWWKITEKEAHNPKSPYANRAGDWLLTCSIITMKSPDDLDLADLATSGRPEATPTALSHLHNRLPVPLHFTGEPTDALTRWLQSGKAPGRPVTQPSGVLTQDARVALAEILDQAYAQTTGWELYPVSTDVGNVRNNGPHLIEPAQDLLSGL